MIDRIIRKNYHEFVIIFTNRSPVTIRSSGNAQFLMEYVLWDMHQNVLN